jgi:hypothetical protein
MNGIYNFANYIADLLSFYRNLKIQYNGIIQIKFFIDYN